MECSINGVDANDNALASLRAGGNNCFDVSMTETKVNKVIVHIRNECGVSQGIGVDRIISIILAANLASTTNSVSRSTCAGRTFDND